MEENQNNILSQVNYHMSLNMKIIDNFNHTVRIINYNEETVEIEIKLIGNE